MTSNDSAGTAYRPGEVGSEWLRGAVGAARNRWIVLLLGALVGGTLGWVLTLTQSASYSSSAVIYQTPRDGDTDGTSRQRTEAYTRLLTSDQLIRSALAQTDLDLSASQVRTATTASANVGSAILTVTVSTHDADTSVELANALAATLPGTVAALDGAGTTVDASGAEVSDAVRLSVVSPAALEDVEGGPKLARNIILGVLAGVLAALLHSYLRTQLSRTVTDRAALEKFLSGPVLAEIPTDPGLQSGLLDFYEGDNPAAEAFRRLRAVVADHEPGDGDARIIVVSSAVAGDGKTAVAVNLAVALAEGGHEVVLVDASDTADQGNGPFMNGLTGYLLNDDDIDGYVRPTRLQKLMILPSGGAVPGMSDLLGTGRMRTGLADLSRRAGYVVVDTAALSTNADALMLGRWADGVLLVARSAQTRYAALGDAVNDFSSAGVSVRGVVLNDHPTSFTLRPGRKAPGRLSAAGLLVANNRIVRSADRGQGPRAGGSPAGYVDRR